MGKMKKKGTSGQAVAYISRTQAIKKLQVTLADFRRLCILKGIYPREPKDRKKVNKGSTQNRTWYFTKDIRFLQHEPLLAKFRDNKTFLKKLTRALSKDDLSGARRLEDNKPIYTLDHIIKERYPTFLDAVRDLDDALCLLFLFATFPASERLTVETVERCKKLTAQFQLWVVREQALRKVFISIKGIYYQAEVRGQTVTWLVPHQFTQRVPRDVDFRVMTTFLSFYESLLGFVNFKLYNDSGLVYPPRIDEIKEEHAAGLAAVIVEAKSARATTSTHAEEEEDEAEAETVSSAIIEERMKTLQAKMASVVEDDARVAKAEAAPTLKDAPSSAIEDFSKLAEGEEGDSSSALQAARSIADQANATRYLFAKHHVFLSRETPIHTLSFVLRSFGVGAVAWDGASEAGSPFKESSKQITLQVSDRPAVSTLYPGRLYVQPQYIVDSVNAGRLLDPATYAPGATLPPHLSPFVTAAPGDYVPTEAAVSFTGVRADDPEDEEAENDDDEEDIEEEEEEAEAEPKKVRVTKGKAQVAALDAVQEEADRKEMAKTMMSKKNRVLYEKMQYGIEKKKQAADILANKKRALSKVSSTPVPAETSPKRPRTRSAAARK